MGAPLTSEPMPPADQHSTLGILYWDAVLCFGIVVLLPVVRWSITSRFVKPVMLNGQSESGANGVGRRTLGPIELEKLKESAWKAFAYGHMASLGLAAVVGQPWSTDTTQFYAGATRVPLDSYTPPIVAVYHLVAMAFYVYSIPALLLSETRRSGFLASLLHHVVTLGLILCAYLFNFMRIGSVVLLLHDVCDVPLEVAKCCRYLQGKDSSAALAFFVVFTITWFAARVVFFPAVVIRSTLTETISAGATMGLAWEELEAMYIGFNGALLFLWCLHLYWSYLIVRAIMRTLAGGGTDDDREGHGD